MKKAKQILAIIGIVILVAMYLATLVLAIALPKYAMGMLFAAIGLTVFIPILLWIAIAFIDRIIKNREELAEEKHE